MKKAVRISALTMIQSSPDIQPDRSFTAGIWRKLARYSGCLQTCPRCSSWAVAKGLAQSTGLCWQRCPELLQGIQVLHITGRLDWSEVEAARARLTESTPPELINRYRIYPYLHEEMGAAFSVADLVVSRAGASTLGELPLFGLPAVLVPYPYAWRYQQVNAQYLAERGAAVIIQDADLKDHLLPEVAKLLADDAGLDSMRAAMRSLSRPDAGVDIASQVLSLAVAGGDRP